MSVFFISKLLTAATGTLFMGIAIGCSEAAFAKPFSFSSNLPISANSFLAQVSPSQNRDIRPTIPGTKSVSPSVAKIPEPATLAGLGVVASSFFLTRRRQGKKEL
ncbi:hypothetical protein BCD67_03945 [Oscillatoriales cyanobacterium USR001]|nr:hypothetical protein BCD67_03945 [Oscillatoriales cyanobacterium USR001]